MSGWALLREPIDVRAANVQCPTCKADVGWACGGSHCDGAHRARILAELRRMGREIRIMRAFADESFIFNLKEQKYYDLAPGYRDTFIRRDGLPLNRDEKGIVRGKQQQAKAT